ncbi:HAMP domain-containing protein [Actinokineospora inagensis]|uniref:HAMP domain-containing protein n=1 Tax=Actinokineospora inagensis TaxID=103730 RepID=UPI0012F82C7D|nr:HAMP domain-containing protein [Actinokineospora inagensis]
MQREEAGSARGERASRLAAQLPEAGFPATVRALPTVLLALFLLLAAATAVLVAGDGERRVPDAFQQSQREIAAGVARSVAAGANQGISDLRTVSVRASGAVDQVLDTLVKNRKWRGAVVLSPTRALVATRGEQVPVQAIPDTVAGAAVTSTISANGEVLLVETTVLPDGKYLAASTTVRLPDVATDPVLKQSFALITLSGKPVGGTAAPGLESLLADAGRAAAAEPGVLLGPSTDQAQTTLAYARVAPSSSPTGVDLAVVAIAAGPVVDGGSRLGGVIPAAALAAIALLGFLVVRRAITNPVRRVRAALLRLAAGEVDTKIHRFRTNEIARITAAARVCQQRLLPGKAAVAAGTAGRRMTVRRITAAVAVLVLAWAGGMVALGQIGSVQIPEAVAATDRAQTGMATDALRRSVNDGLAALVATTQTAKGADQLKQALDGLHATQTRYRSLYVVDAAGQPGDVVGRPPLRTAETPSRSAGLRQQNQGGRVPVLFAEAPLPGQSGSVIGEFDVDHLGDLLGHVPGHARVVDAQFRTIVAAEGYVAFEEVTSDELRACATEAQKSGLVGRISGDGQSFIAAAAVLGGDVGRLGWTVVTEQPGTELSLPVNETRRYTQLVALLAALLALFGYGWLLFAVLSPLRRVATAADAIVAGDLDSVIYPQRPDEIGTIASCLEICRQAAVEGPQRLGEVRRPSGAATDMTQLIRAVVDPPPTHRPIRHGGKESPTGGTAHRDTVPTRKHPGPREHTGPRDPNNRPAPRHGTTTQQRDPAGKGSA